MLAGLQGPCGFESHRGHHHYTRRMSDEKQKRGPDPERVKIDEDWEDAVKKALRKKRPEEGWPKPESEKPEDQQDRKQKD